MKRKRRPHGELPSACVVAEQRRAAEAAGAEAEGAPPLLTKPRSSSSSRSEAPRIASPSFLSFPLFLSLVSDLFRCDRDVS